MGHREDSPEKEVYNNTGLLNEDRKISNKQPNTTCTRTRGQRKTKLRVSRRKEIIKIWAELNDIETKKKHSREQ